MKKIPYVTGAVLLFSVGFIIGRATIKEAKINSANIRTELLAPKELANSRPDAFLGKEMQAVVDSGNKGAFISLENYYATRMYSEILPWALILANKHNEGIGYYGVYFSLYSAGWSKTEEYSLDHLDITTQNMALDYLTKAAELGHSTAIRDYKRYKGNKKYSLRNIEIKNFFENE